MSGQSWNCWKKRLHFPKIRLMSIYDTWADATVETLKKLGSSRVSLRQIYRVMRSHELVTAYHLEPWKLGGQPRYECWIRGALPI